MSRFATLFAALIAALVATTAVKPIAMASDDLDRPLPAPTSWIKFCLKAGDGATTTTCHTGADVWNRVDGKVLASVEMIDRQGDGKSTLRVNFPLTSQLVQGTRLTLDEKVLPQNAVLGCSKDGCVSDYEIGPEIMNSIKSGGKLLVQAIGQSGTMLTATLPLIGFAEAHDGLPSSEAELDQWKQRSHRWLDDRRFRR